MKTLQNAGMWLFLKTNCNSIAFITLLLIVCTFICMWKFYFLSTEHRRFIHHDNHGLPRSRLQRVISLASITQRDSASLSASSKILRKGLIRCPPLYHHLWPAGEVIMYLYDGSRSDFVKAGLLERGVGEAVPFLVLKDNNSLCTFGAPQLCGIHNAKHLSCNM